MKTTMPVQILRKKMLQRAETPQTLFMQTYTTWNKDSHVSRPS